MHHPVALQQLGQRRAQHFVEPGGALAAPHHQQHRPLGAAVDAEQSASAPGIPFKQLPA